MSLNWQPENRCLLWAAAYLSVQQDSRSGCKKYIILCIVSERKMESKTTSMRNYSSISSVAHLPLASAGGTCHIFMSCIMAHSRLFSYTFSFRAHLSVVCKSNIFFLWVSLYIFFSQLAVNNFHVLYSRWQINGVD